MLNVRLLILNSNHCAMRGLEGHRAFGLKPKKAGKEMGKEKARQKGTEKLNYGGEKEDTTKSRRHCRS